MIQRIVDVHRPSSARRALVRANLTGSLVSTSPNQVFTHAGARLVAARAARAKGSGQSKCLRKIDKY